MFCTGQRSNSTKKGAAENNGESDDWKAECTKDYDLKLTKAGGNKIRRIMTPPIFSSGMLDILLVE